MLNYIWAGLVGLSFVFALVYDTRDLVNDTYRNGEPVPVSLVFEQGYRQGARRQEVTVRLDNEVFQTFYATQGHIAEQYSGTLIQTEDGRQLRFARDVEIPVPLSTIRDVTSSRDNDLRGVVRFDSVSSGNTAAANVTFSNVRFVKMHAIAQAAFDLADTAVTLALGLIGVIALWMGLLQIAEKAGLIKTLVRFTQPILRPLFPEIPDGHPAMGMIALNLTANMLGLGNAATPLGIKAMEELQALNSQKDTATNSMVMLLAMNTASVQLVPPVMLVALMGLQINQLIFAILIVTSVSLVVGIVSARLLGRMKRYRATDPANTVSEHSEGKN
jgi:spore maturation protein A